MDRRKFKKLCRRLLVVSSIRKAVEEFHQGMEEAPDGLWRSGQGAVERAITLNEDCRMRYLLQALLFSRDATINSVATVLNLDEEVLVVFTDLFFNVIDRRQELTYIFGIGAVIASGRDFQTGKPVPREHSTLLAQALSIPFRQVLQLAGLGPIPAIDGDELEDPPDPGMVAASRELLLSFDKLPTGSAELNKTLKIACRERLSRERALDTGPSFREVMLGQFSAPVPRDTVPISQTSVGPVTQPLFGHAISQSRGLVVLDCGSPWKPKPLPLSLIPLRSNSCAESGYSLVTIRRAACPPPGMQPEPGSKSQPCTPGSLEAGSPLCDSVSMTCSDIQALLPHWLKPAPTSVRLSPPWALSEGVQYRRERIEQADRPDFGFAFALWMVTHGKTDDIPEGTAYRWVRVAAAVLETERKRNPGHDHYLDHVDVGRQAVKQARELHDKSTSRWLLQAALICRNANIPVVAEALGLERDVVDAFANLFYNVIARRTDTGFCQKIAAQLATGQDGLLGKRIPTEQSRLLGAAVHLSLDQVMEAAGFGMQATTNWEVAVTFLNHLTDLAMRQVPRSSESPMQVRDLVKMARCAEDIAKSRTAGSGWQSTGEFTRLVEAQFAKDREQLELECLKDAEPAA